MFRNIQFKIITIFFLIGIIIIAGLGVFFLTSIHGLEQQIINSNFQNIQEEIQILQNLKTNTIMILIIIGVLLAIVGLLIAGFLSKFVIYPINKLIKSAEKVSDEDKKKAKNK